jgi:hypothetical protein
MKENRSFLKPLLWAYSAVGAFTAISIAVPILWDRLANRSNSNNNAGSASRSRKRTSLK